MQGARKGCCCAACDAGPWCLVHVCSFLGGLSFLTRSSFFWPGARSIYILLASHKYIRTYVVYTTEYPFFRFISTICSTHYHPHSVLTPWTLALRCWERLGESRIIQSTWLNGQVVTYAYVSVTHGCACEHQETMTERFPLTHTRQTVTYDICLWVDRLMIGIFFAHKDSGS